MKSQLNKYKYILIDGNNFYWTAMTSIASNIEEYSNEIYLRGLYAAIDRTKQIHSTFLEDGGEIYFLFDNPLSKINFREWISNGDYKHTRKEMPDEFYQIMKEYKLVLSSFSDNYKFVQVDGYEADDLVKPVLEHLNTNKKVLLVSNDMDWTRSMSANVDWLKAHSIYNLQAFKNTYGFIPDENKVKMYKSIHGDSSDNIPNTIPNIRKEVLLYLVNEYKNIGELLNAIDYDDKISDKWKEKIYKAKSTLISNYALVDFLPFEGSIENHIYKSERNILDLKVSYDVFGFPYESFMLTSEEDFIDSFFKSDIIEVR